MAKNHKEKSISQIYKKRVYEKRGPDRMARLLAKELIKRFSDKPAKDYARSQMLVSIKKIILAKRAVDCEQPKAIDTSSDVATWALPSDLWFVTLA